LIVFIFIILKKVIGGKTRTGGKLIAYDPSMPISRFLIDPGDGPFRASGYAKSARITEFMIDYQCCRPAGDLHGNTVFYAARTGIIQSLTNGFPGTDLHAFKAGPAF
jgi:hypothetical protein